MWQDYALTACNVALNISLIPSLRSQHKPAKATCLLYFATLWIISIIEWTLNLPLSSSLTFVATLGWYWLWQQDRLGA